MALTCFLIMENLAQGTKLISVYCLCELSIIPYFRRNLPPRCDPDRYQLLGMYPDAIVTGLTEPTQLEGRLKYWSLY